MSIGLDDCEVLDQFPDLTYNLVDELSKSWVLIVVTCPSLKEEQGSGPEYPCCISRS